MSDGAVGGCLSIYVVVSDVVRSVNFYQNLLALEFVVINWDDKGQDRGAFCELPDGVRLILSQESGRSAAVPQNFWLEFETDDVVAARNRIAGAGLSVSVPVKNDAGSLSVSLTDPDGYEVRLSERWRMPCQEKP